MMRNYMDSVSMKKGRRKSEKTLLKERNKRTNLMHKRIKNTTVKNHGTRGRLSNGESKDLSNGNVKVKCGRKKRLGVKKERCYEIIPISVVRNDDFETEDSTQENEMHENHLVVTERLNSANQILDNISVTLENIQNFVMEKDYSKSKKKEMVDGEKKVLRNEKKKVEKDIKGMRKDILKVRKLFEDAKNKNEVIKKNVENLMKQNSSLRESERYKTELCEDLHDKIAALESHTTVEYYWSQSLKESGYQIDVKK